MRNHLVLKGMTVWMASLGLLFPPQFLMAAGEPVTQPQVSATSANAAPVAREAVQIRDVELGPHGQFAGQIVNAQGKPISGAAIILRNRSVQLQAISNTQGQFQFSSLSGGTYHLEGGQGGQLCRLWKNGTAPPKANGQMLLVQQDGPVALGQNCGTPVCGSPVRGGTSRAKRFLTHPLVIGGLVAAAIAIPVAIHNSDDDDGPSS
jgi:hypothetical protein